MSKIVIAIVALCLVQVSVARIVREAPQPESESGLLALFHAANETFSELNKAFLRVAGVQSNSELVTKLSDRFKTFANDAEANILKLQKETEPLNSQARDLVKAFTDKVTSISEKLKAENPDFVNNNINQIAEESAKLRDRLAEQGVILSDKTQVLLKGFVDSAIETASQAKTQVDTLLAPPAAKKD